MSETKQHPVNPAKSRKKTGLMVLIIVIIVVVVGLLIAGWWWFVQPAFVIDGHKYSKATYFNMMSAAKKNGVGQKAATVQYIQIEKERIAAEKLNVTPTQNTINSTTVSTYSGKTYDQLDIWQKEIVYSQSLTPAIEFNKRGGYTGAMFIFPFSKLLEPLSGAYKGQKPAGYRDPVKVEEDRAYARQQAEDYHTKVANGADEQKLIAEIRANPRLQFPGSPNTSAQFQLSDFNNLSAQQLTTSTYNVFNQNLSVSSLQGQNSVGLSEIKTGQTVQFDLPNKPTVDAYYYFYKINAYSTANADIQKQFDSAVSSMKVETNV